MYITLAIIQGQLVTRWWANKFNNIFLEKKVSISSNINSKNSKINLVKKVLDNN